VERREILRVSSVVGSEILRRGFCYSVAVTAIPTEEYRRRVCGEKQHRAHFMAEDFDADDADGSETSCADTLPLAVAKAAAKALGIEEAQCEEK